MIRGIMGRLAVYGWMALVAATCGAQEVKETDKPTIEDEQKAAEKLIQQKQFDQALPHLKNLLKLLVEKPDKTPEEQFLLGTTYLHLAASAFDDSLKAKGLDPAKAKSAQAWRDHLWSKGLAAGTSEKLRVVGRGERVNLEDYLTPGKTTLVDFYSEYCGPCRQIAPYIEKLVQKREDLMAVKVDINRPETKGIDWKSPVAQQYGLQSIPHFKIYGPDGKLVAEGDAAYKQVMTWIQSLGE